MQARAAARRATEAAQAHIQVKKSDPQFYNREEGAADPEGTILTASSSLTVQTTVTATTTRSDVAPHKPNDIVPSTTGAATLVSSTTTTRKRGRKTPSVPVRGGWDVLPHNLGQVWAPKDVADEKAGSAAHGNLYEDNTDLPLKKRLRSNRASSSNDVVPAPVNHEQPPPNAAEEQEVKEQLEQQSPPEAEQKTPKRKARKTKDNPYGLTPGETPYPDWQGPNAQQCEEIYRILADMHDDVQPLPPQRFQRRRLKSQDVARSPASWMA
ncbi:hypothetical protein PG997_004909 [Apiospora hydei]|uniref:Uncharacterized protein n=1 Tax=Apiospora hydei TaxID=1337664 RepID=A0ABR1X3F8_9PEZI